MITSSIKLWSHKQNYDLSSIWRNLHENCIGTMKLTKIRNQREAKKFSFLGGLPYEEVRKFSISERGLPHEGGGEFSMGRFISSAYYVSPAVKLEPSQKLLPSVFMVQQNISWKPLHDNFQGSRKILLR